MSGTLALKERYWVFFDLTPYGGFWGCFSFDSEADARQWADDQKRSEPAIDGYTIYRASGDRRP